jgi:hypothetical protein
MARIAKSLDVLRDELDEEFPRRSKSSDGWIGDAAHAARESDHNPNSADVVQALDITHDPAGGLDAGKIADKLLASKDSRIKYLISNGRIGSSYATGGVPAWTWRPYTGSNAHRQHFHISVVDDPIKYDSTERWNITSDMVPEPMPTAPVSSYEHQRMARTIINYEYAPRPFKIYQVTDGSNEIAGLNQKKHPDYYAKVAAVVGDDAAVEHEVSKFILDYTNAAMQWTSSPQVEFYLRDSIYNRGPTGAAIILQKAVGVEQDGVVGADTKAAVAKLSPDALLSKLRVAREEYELEKYGRREALWKGLTNRWNNSLADAKTFGAAPIPVEPPKPVEPPVVVVPPVVVPPITPTPVPPTPPGTIDFVRLERLNSLDIELLVRSYEQTIANATQGLNELKTKMKLNTPAAIMEAVRSGKTAAEIKEEREMSTTNTTTTDTAVVDVKPAWQSKTFWSALIAGAVPILHILTRGNIAVDPVTQDWIATALTTVAGFAAAFFRTTSSTVTAAGAANARSHQ